VVATCFALVGFAAAVTVGTVVGSAMGVVILHGLLIMFICWIIGHAVGVLTQRTVDQHIKQYKELFPMPKAEIQASDQDDQAGMSDQEAVATAQPVTGPTEEVSPVNPGV